MPSSNYMEIYFLKNFFLPYLATPINPDPTRSMVAGSGTGTGVTAVARGGENVVAGQSRLSGMAYPTPAKENLMRPRLSLKCHRVYYLQ
jgi:hypothetical protein